MCRTMKNMGYRTKPISTAEIINYPKHPHKVLNMIPYNPDTGAIMSDEDFWDYEGLPTYLYRIQSQEGKIN